MSDYGWTGKILLVDLTTRETSLLDSHQWLPSHIGAAGLGLALYLELVPPGAAALSAANLFFLGSGPLTGSWAPCAGRGVAISKSPASYPVEQVAQSSLGGQLPTELKWAGYDGVALVGAADAPVALVIDDSAATLIDATDAWGLDAFASQAWLQDRLGSARFKCLAIGPAGEQRARNAAVIHGGGHALGQCGFGGVWGAKRLKGIAVRGTGRVRTATALADFSPRLDEIRRSLALMQSVRPSTVDTSSRWRARDGLTWNGGETPIEIGAIPADDLSRQGLRHCGSDVYMGGLLADQHVKNTGCYGCVMNCFSAVAAPQTFDDVPAIGEMNCVQMLAGWFAHSGAGSGQNESSAAQAYWTTRQADMFGVNAYDLRMLVPLLVHCEHALDGLYRQALDAPLREELDQLPWSSLLESGDGGMAFFRGLFELLASAEPDADTLGAWLLQGAPRAAERLGMADAIWTGEPESFEGFTVGYTAHGQRRHYGPERYGVATGLHWMVWNRDPNRHEYNGLVSWSGLTWDQKRRVAEIHFGDPDVINDPAEAWSPGAITPARIELARFLMARALLKDSLTLCDWVFPNYCSPLVEREYAGDLGLEAELYRAITGDQVGADELDRRAEALVDLYRALTAIDWDTTDLRGGVGYPDGDYRGHDNLAAWYFVGPDGEPRLDREYFEQAKTELYELLGWDAAGGVPTRAKLEADGLGAVADALEALGLLPD